MKGWIWLSLLAASLIGTPARADDEPSTWKTLNETWDGGTTASVWKIVSWPGRDLLIASVRSQGLWSSADGGQTWKRMGEPGKTPPSAGQAVQFVFDPKDPNTMWTSGMYNYGVWKTADGGKTFTHISNNNHVDGFAVDFSDPERKIQLMGLHEQEHSLHKSTDGGATWTKIGEKIPAGSEFSTDPIILDARTYIIDSNGWSKPGEHWGIYRTEDGGETWTNVSQEGAAGNATITSKGDIFWSVQWDQQIIKSSDHGKTWERIKSPARGIVAEVRPDRLVALGGNRKAQMYVSKDDGKTWTPFGDPLPFKARGFAYNAVRNCLIAWEDRAESARREGSLARFDLPADLDSAFVPKSSDLTVWDGEGYADGNGWISPREKNSFTISTAEHFNGRQSLEFHAEGVESSTGGWNWANWKSSAVTDISGYESLSFYIKLTGDKPTAVEVSLASGPDKAASETVAIGKYTPDFMDGKWHRVIVPLKDLYGASKFNPKTAYEIRLMTKQGKKSSFNVYVDVVRFLKPAAK